MKILFPIDIFYPSQFGGPANSVHALAKTLVKNGMDVSVITTSFSIHNGEVEYNKWIKVDGINVYYLKVPNFKKTFFQSFYFYGG